MKKLALKGLAYDVAAHIANNVHGRVTTADNNGKDEREVSWELSAVVVVEVVQGASMKAAGTSVETMLSRPSGHDTESYLARDHEKTRNAVLEVTSHRHSVLLNSAALRRRL